MKLYIARRCNFVSTLPSPPSRRGFQKGAGLGRSALFLLNSVALARIAAARNKNALQPRAAAEARNNGGEPPAVGQKPEKLAGRPFNFLAIAGAPASRLSFRRRA